MHDPSITPEILDACGISFDTTAWSEARASASAGTRERKREVVDLVTGDEIDDLAEEALFGVAGDDYPEVEVPLGSCHANADLPIVPAVLSPERARPLPAGKDKRRTLQTLAFHVLKKMGRSCGVAGHHSPP